MRPPDKSCILTLTNGAARAEGRYARLVDSGIIGVLVSDINGNVSDANETLATITGYSRAEILGGSVPWRTLTPPGYEELDAWARSQMLTTGAVGLREKEYIRKDGTRVPILIGSARLDGEPAEYLSFILDVSERKRAETLVAQLREERLVDQRFRDFLEAAPDAKVIVNSDGLMVLVKRPDRKAVWL